MGFMARKPVDRAAIDVMRAGISAHHAHRWVKVLQRSLAGTEPDWAAYRNALAYLSLTEKHLTDWLAVASEDHPGARNAAVRKVSGRPPDAKAAAAGATRRRSSR